MLVISSLSPQSSPDQCWVTRRNTGQGIHSCTKGKGFFCWTSWGEEPTGCIHVFTPEEKTLGEKVRLTEQGSWGNRKMFSFEVVYEPLCLELGGGDSLGWGFKLKLTEHVAHMQGHGKGRGPWLWWKIVKQQWENGRLTRAKGCVNLRKDCARRSKWLA